MPLFLARKKLYTDRHRLDRADKQSAHSFTECNSKRQGRRKPVITSGRKRYKGATLFTTLSFTANCGVPIRVRRYSRHLSWRFSYAIFRGEKRRKKGGKKKKGDRKRFSLQRSIVILPPSPSRCFVAYEFSHQARTLCFFPLCFWLDGSIACHSGKIYRSVQCREPFNAGNLSTMMILFARR